MKKTHTRTENLEANLLQLVNQERQKKNCSPLQGMSKLSEVAVFHSIEMLQFNKIYHDSQKTGSVGDRVKRAKLPYLACAENVAMGGDLKQCHIGLMNSPGHRKNILNKTYTHAGMGIVRNEKGMLFVTQVFLEQLAALDLEQEKKKVISEIHALRSKRKRTPLQHISLDITNKLVTKISTSSAGQLKQFDINPSFPTISKELQTKKVAFRQLSATWFTGKSVALKSVQKQLLNPKLKGFSLGISVNEGMGCLCAVFVFWEG